MNICQSYTVTFLSEKRLEFESVDPSTIHSGIWKECEIKPPGNKYIKIFESQDGQYIGEAGGNLFIKFHSEEDLQLTFSNSFVLFKEQFDDRIHPFLLLDEHEVIFALNNSQLEKVEIRATGSCFYEYNFYQFTDGRILAAYKTNPLGELYMNLDDLVAYFSFIAGSKIEVVFEGPLQ